METKETLSTREIAGGERERDDEARFARDEPARDGEPRDEQTARDDEGLARDNEPATNWQRATTRRATNRWSATTRATNRWSATTSHATS